jgi:hypothetical protein
MRDYCIAAIGSKTRSDQYGVEFEIEAHRLALKLAE